MKTGKHYYEDRDPYGLHDMQFDPNFIMRVYAEERGRAIYRAYLAIIASGSKRPQAELAECCGLSKGRIGQIVQRQERILRRLGAGLPHGVMHQYLNERPVWPWELRMADAKSQAHNDAQSAIRAVGQAISGPGVRVQLERARPLFDLMAPEPE